MHELIQAIGKLTDFGDRLMLAPADEDTRRLIAAINSLVERLGTRFERSEREGDSLAAASVRMVLLADIQTRLGYAEERVKNVEDLEHFLQGVLADFAELVGARSGMYVTMASKSGQSNRLLTFGLDAALVDALHHSVQFRQLVAEVGTIGDVISRPAQAGADCEIMGLAMLIAPLWVNGRTVGVIFLLDPEQHAAFSKDDLALLDHLLLPDILRILERVELLRTLERINQSLHVEQEKQKLLIEQLESAQGQLLQSEKMASVGQLAAGVAHEINNPIGYVYSNLNSLDKYVQEIVSLLDQYVAEETSIGDSQARARLAAARQSADIDYLREDLRALMDESREGLVRVKKIVQDLKDFSHADTVEEWQFSDLHAGLDSTLNIVNNELKYKAEVVREYGDIPVVECLLPQLNQVFMNMLVNAAHAIDSKGTITVRTGRQGSDQVWVEFSDTGCGISPANLKRIFDPFFTTKPVGKGTGLGLSLSYGIVQKHHGHIDVHSEPGCGTTFRITLPVRQFEAGAAPVA